jgi:hypothetical protein
MQSYRNNDGSLLLTADDGATLTVPTGTQEEQDAAVAAFLGQHPDIPAPVPDSVPLWKLKVALQDAGLMGNITAIVEGESSRVQIWWNGAPDVTRGCATFGGIAETASISGQIDDLFRTANNISF